MITLFNMTNQELTILVFLAANFIVLIKFLIDMSTRLSLVEAKLSELLEGKLELGRLKCEMVSEFEIMYSKINDIDKREIQCNTSNLLGLQELHLEFKGVKSELENINKEISLIKNK